jgi:SAM-dependent methyltransferase
MNNAPFLERAFYENPDYWLPERCAGPDEERVQLAMQWLPHDARSALDLGCGNGVLTNQLCEARQVVGLDRSMAALRWVRSPCCQGDAASLPFQDSAFDAVVVMVVMEHLSFPAFRLAQVEMARISRRYLLVSVLVREDRDGLQIVCPICGCRFHRYRHVRRFEREDMEKLSDGGSTFKQ